MSSWQLVLGVNLFTILSFFLIFVQSAWAQTESEQGLVKQVEITLESIVRVNVLMGHPFTLRNGGERVVKAEWAGAQGARHMIYSLTHVAKDQVAATREIQVMARLMRDRPEIIGAMSTDWQISAGRLDPSQKFELRSPAGLARVGVTDDTWSQVESVTLTVNLTQSYPRCGEVEVALPWPQLFPRGLGVEVTLDTVLALADLRPQPVVVAGVQVLGYTSSFFPDSFILATSRSSLVYKPSTGELKAGAGWRHVTEIKAKNLTVEVMDQDARWGLNLLPVPEMNNWARWSYCPAYDPYPIL